MNQIVHSFETARVLIVGDVILDRYWYGTTARISPEAPVPVVHVKKTEDRPGGAGNVAINVTSLGAHATLIGVTGDDAEAVTLQQQLMERRVSCVFSKSRDVKTVTKLRVLSQQQQLIRLDFEDPASIQQTSSLFADFEAQLEFADVVVLSDYAKGAITDASRFIQLARAAGKQVLVDPKGSDFSRYHGASLITPNLKEFEAVVGPSGSDEELADKAIKLCNSLALDALLVTRSEQGMTLVQANGVVTHLPAKAREVFDVTGAGDTVIGTLAASLAAGHNLVHATALANTAAGIVVGHVGAASVTLQELEAALHEFVVDSNKGLSEEDLILAIQAARLRGETIVMTNGCFDILHAGHVQYLEEARSLGDRLIIAVNDDASVARLKGPQRPINGLQNRCRVLAALSSVDWVIAFSEDTPERIINRIIPNVLVKGGDYSPEQIAGAQCVTDHGGSVRVLPFRDNCSTSAIIAAIQQQES
jgi:D-beta-D-heptose 7-phosphate kinase/D-beta-D-heptose 1-phosphate adenosyltransferase